MASTPRTIKTHELLINRSQEAISRSHRRLKRLKALEDWAQRIEK
jgi:hypothetical protein